MTSINSDTESFAYRVLKFYSSLTPPVKLPMGVNSMVPFKSREVLKYVKQFYRAFFDDQNERIYAFGINPGRFGGGATGIPFTDPFHLENHCGIANTLAKRKELSAEFIYSFIEKWGGPREFYKHFFITATSPIGFCDALNGTNLNYYDTPELKTVLRPYIVKLLKKQLNLGANRNVAIVIGQGKNYEELREINLELKLFKELIPVKHPRPIMQYERNSLIKYIGEYIRVFKSALKKS